MERVAKKQLAKKEGGLEQFEDLREAWSKRGGGISEGRSYPNEHYVIFC